MNNEYLNKIQSIGIEQKKLESVDYKEEFTFRYVKKGMGTTIGNALRRVLLSQIPGYAIRYVSIQGVQHEFDSFPGLKEDIADFIANLRKIVFRGIAANGKASLNIVKAGEIFASDIKGLNLDVVNKELYLGSLLKFEKPLKVEMFVEKNVGVILTREANELNPEAGAIVCNSFFSPIVHVNFLVEEIENNIENLKLLVVTNGVITPASALKYALDLISEQMGRCNFDGAVVHKEELTAKQINIMATKLNMKIENLSDISSKILKCLREMGVVYIGDLVKLKEKQLLEKPNFGATSLSILKNKLEMLGLELGMEIEFSPEKIRPSDNSIVDEFIG